VVRTYYIAAYDTEMYDTTRLGPGVPSCLEACFRIVEVHRRFNMPATFFIVGKALEANPAEYRALLDDPLFEIASHTYSHKMLLDHPICGRAASPPEIEQEIRRGKQVVEEVFGRPCVGMRTGCGFSNGLAGATDILRLNSDAGYAYVSSQLWGPDFSLPAPLNPPFTYAEEGFPVLRELPGHGWHENLLKGNNRIFGYRPSRTLLFPPTMPEAIPDRYVETPEEEFAVNRIFLDRAAADNLLYISLIWHPWSLMLFDPAMRMLELTFTHVRALDLQPTTFAGLNATLSAIIAPPLARIDTR
jgi:peptidoglycan/xylan/chitin deacetylase (PgdA/CDA1 family)